VIAVVPSFAKLNLDLRILNKRPDGYHELRTIFQTIRLQDSLTIQFDKARTTEVTLDSSIDIPDNLVLRAAHAILDRVKKQGKIRLTLKKVIPMGAGLGGGSSNAAAVLIALPALMGVKLSIPELVALSESLGSDVAFFLYGGTALGIGRGTELYPLPEQPEQAVVVLETGIHVSTGKAYQDLNRPLTSDPSLPMLREFQSVAWALGEASLGQLALSNDFEQGVFLQHPLLAASAKKLRRAGARPVRMTGSGSALFGIFDDKRRAVTASELFPPEVARVTSFLPRRRYRSLWIRALGAAAPASCFSPREES
jgi:4-diphosphocytidyl-2-C-methyl-D-erythritol kinase